MVQSNRVGEHSVVRHLSSRRGGKNQESRMKEMDENNNRGKTEERGEGKV